MKKAANADIIVMSAAVADFTPKNVASKKIKKGEADLSKVELVPTKDILLELGKKKSKKQILVGFALETDHEEENAKKKIKNKNLDLIVLNSLQNKGAGFKTDTNKISIIDRHNKITRYELKPKSEVAADIAEKIILLLKD